MSNTKKSFNKRLVEWRKNYPVLQEEMDAIDRKRSVSSIESLENDIVSQVVDINGYSEKSVFQEWANKMSISKEEADEIYRKRDPARASEFFADCDHKSVDRNGEW